METRKVIHRKSRFKRASEVWKRYYEVKHGLVGIIIIMFFIFLALSAPLLFPKYPGILSRIGPNYAAPEWLQFTDPNAPPYKNYILDSNFDNASLWFFSTTDNQTGTYEYDTSDFVTGTRSVKLTLTDNSTTETFNTEVKAYTSFKYRYTDPKWVEVRFHLKSRFNGSMSTGSVTPYINIVQPPGYPQHLGYFEQVHPYPTEWKGFTRSLHYLGYYFTFQKNNIVTFEFGLDFYEDSDPTETGSAEFWFDKIEIYVSPPYWGPFGTTDRGQDVLAQLFWGAQVSLYIGLVATFIGVTVGLFVGLVSGFFGGAVDELLMRIVDFFLIMPGLPIMMVLSAILSPSLEVTVFIIAIFAWPGPSRIIRSQVLVEKEKAYVEAAKSAGAGDVYLIYRHIFPNVLTLVFVQLATGVSNSIINEAGLSFLGLTPQGLVSWGRMLQASYATGAMTIGAWWFVIPPGLFIALLSMGFVFIGYAVDKAMNPRLRKL
ncbi:MAG: ABC transporter permease [Candidatus Hodarchaeota archaeon]